MSTRSDVAVGIEFETDMSNARVVLLMTPGETCAFIPSEARKLASAIIEAADNADRHGASPCDKDPIYYPSSPGKRVCQLGKQHEGSCKFTCGRQIDVNGIFNVYCALDFEHDGECKSESDLQKSGEAP